jgi:predicted transposase/invertase (TIGR01784 family)
MASNLDPKLDYVFKRLFSDEDNALLLVDLLNAVLGFVATRRVRGVLLLNPFVAQDYAAGKVPILDVRARDDLGRQFLVEMQRLQRAALARRLLYYWSGGHAEQLLKGERYEMLQPTYTLCFLNEPLFSDAVYHHCFRVYDEAHGVLLCQDLEIHLVELSKFDLAVEAVQTPLERWCYFFKHGASLDPAQLPATLDIPIIRKAVEVLVKLSREEIERHWAAERVRAERDAADLLATARHDGHQQGFQEGIEKGMEKGIEKGMEKGIEKGMEKGIEKGMEKGIEKGKFIGRIQLLQQLLQQLEMSNEALNQLGDEQLLQLAETLQRQFENKRSANGTPPTGQT